MIFFHVKVGHGGVSFTTWMLYFAKAALIASEHHCKALLI